MRQSAAQFGHRLRVYRDHLGVIRSGGSGEPVRARHPSLDMLREAGHRAVAQPVAGEGEVAFLRIRFDAAVVGRERGEVLAVSDNVQTVAAGAAFNVPRHRSRQLQQLFLRQLVEVDALPVTAFTIGTEREAQPSETFRDFVFPRVCYVAVQCMNRFGPRPEPSAVGFAVQFAVARRAVDVERLLLCCAQEPALGGQYMRASVESGSGSSLVKME